MFCEIRGVRQIPGERFRRWFASDQMDLVVWLDDGGGICGFQLSYHTASDERAVTWWSDRGFRHSRVDSGEGPGMGQTPILMRGGRFSKRRVLAEFRKISEQMDAEIARFVLSKLERV